MGQFSWIYSDTDKQLVDNKKADAYLLVPPPFQEKYGKAIYEGCYDGYGHFGIYDVYDLIVEWNKQMIPEIIERIEAGKWRCDSTESNVRNLRNYYEGKNLDCELRLLGIVIACYDEDNFVLQYPIKITSKEMDYECVKPSKGDPCQGWESCEEEKWENEFQIEENSYEDDSCEENEELEDDFLSFKRGRAR